MITPRATFTVQSILTKVSATTLAAEQINRGIAFIRAHKACFYDLIAGSQCMTLDQMEANKGLILSALAMLPDASIRANGYKIIHNPLWGMWQCHYDGARYGEFRELSEAIDYCNKG